MSIENKLNDLSEKIKNSRSIITSEEHTKMAYIIPLIQILGYDVFNPNEVIPEYTCDFGVKKGEKVDYAICIDSNPHIIIECKDCRTSLTKQNISQLYRYFSVSSAKIAILTNGIEYLLFTDSAEQNKMDSVPFYTFNILDYNYNDIEVLTKLKKENIKKSDILSQPRLMMFKDEFLNWLSSQHKGVSNKFIQYIKKNLNTFSLSDDEIGKIISEVLSDLEAKEVNRENFDKVDTEYKSSTKRNITAKGVTGLYCLSSDNLLDVVVGSKVVFFKLYDKVYNCDKFYMLYDILLDYCLDKLGITKDKIISLELSKKVFYISANDIKGSNIKCHRDLYYNAGVSAQYLIKNVKTPDELKFQGYVVEFCDAVCIDKDSVTLGLLSKEDNLKYNSLSSEDEKLKFLNWTFNIVLG